MGKYADKGVIEEPKTRTKREMVLSFSDKIIPKTIYVETI